jgi:hypothetical protein
VLKACPKQANSKRASQGTGIDREPLLAPKIDSRGQSSLQRTQSNRKRSARLPTKTACPVTRRRFTGLIIVMIHLSINPVNELTRFDQLAAFCQQEKLTASDIKLHRRFTILRFTSDLSESSAYFTLKVARA